MGHPYLTHVTVGVIEVLDGGQIRLWRERDRLRQACLVAPQTRGDGDVVLFIEDLDTRSWPRRFQFAPL